MNEKRQVVEDLSYVVLLRKKLSYIESIPGVLLPHPSSAAYPLKMINEAEANCSHYQNNINLIPQEYYDMRITPSMSSLEALLSKLPSVAPPSSSSSFQPHSMDLKQEYHHHHHHHINNDVHRGSGETSAAAGSMAPPYHQHYSYHHDLNVSSSMNNDGC